MRIIVHLMKLRRPHLKLTYVLVPDDELQTPYDILWLLKYTDPHNPRMLKDIFLSLTETLVEKYSPPFDDGLELDNRRGLLK